MANTPTSPSSRRQKLNHRRHDDHNHNEQALIPGLPDDIAQLCLSHLRHPSILFSVSLSWRRLLYSPSFPPFLSLYAVLSPSPPPPYSLHRHRSSNSVQISAFDPISSTWHSLPPPPPPLLLLLRHHPSFLSRNLPIQSVAVAGNLILLAGTTHNLHPALSRPLIFNPISRTWSFGPSLPNPRRWCGLGASRGCVYVASGVGTHFSIDVARSLEKWDLRGGAWEKKRDLKHGRFSREAMDAVGWRGKVCLVNVKAKEGVVYDVDRDTWQEMREGMLWGWRGPVAAMDEDVMYGVDEADGVLRKYDQHRDSWDHVMESQRFRGAEQLVAEAGRLCVVSGAGISVVDVTAAPPRMWVVDLPPGFEAVAVQVLPRMPVL